MINPPGTLQQKHVGTDFRVQVGNTQELVLFPL